MTNVDVLSRIARIAAIAAFAVAGSLVVARAQAPEPSYANRLRALYGDRVVYSSENARQVVEAFEIDCKARDGRTLPLVHVFFAKMHRMREVAWTVAVIDRGDEVRIYDRVVFPDGKRAEYLAYEINRWGELRIMDGTRSEALLNTCFGSHGRLWVEPAGSPPPQQQAEVRASFDCARAKSIAEKLICGDAGLAALDRAVAQAYRDALRTSTDPETLKRESLAAWKDRETRCRDRECLAGWFNARLATLKR